jgi:hypothetical protein
MATKTKSSAHKKTPNKGKIINPKNSVLTLPAGLYVPKTAGSFMSKSDNCP